MKKEKLQINYVSPSELIPNEKNPRINESAIEPVMKSIKHFGFKNPIIAQKSDNMIIAGHTRWKAALKSNMKSVPVVFVDMTKTDAKLYNIGDNKLSEIALWDVPMLSEVMQELNELDIDLNIAGFGDGEIDDLLSDFNQYEGLTDEDDIPETPEPICKTGDLWKLGNHRLLCGDCMIKENVEKLMDGKKVDMVFTDPPYGINYQDLKHKHKKIENDNGVLISQLLVLLPSDCPIYICCNWKSYPGFFKIIPDLKALIVWDKKYGVQNLDKFYKRHEFIIYRGEFGGEKTVDGDVWQIEREIRIDHPTAKPGELIKKAVNYSSKKKDIILDLFIGSGSTLIACEKTNRICYGMEIESHYCDVIIERWQNFTGKKVELLK